MKTIRSVDLGKASIGEAVRSFKDPSFPHAESLLIPDEVADTQPAASRPLSLPSTNPVASPLCQACGLCCNGVLFHTVRLQADDSPRELAALGLRLKRKRGENHLLQPCPAFCTTECSIYPQRPVRCRLFECRQLKGVASGEITEETARERIREVQRRVERLEELSRRADGRPRKGPLSKRCETALGEPFDMTTHPEWVGQREELARGLEALDAILDAEFRLPPGDGVGYPASLPPDSGVRDAG